MNMKEFMERVESENSGVELMGICAEVNVPKWSMLNENGGKEKW